MQYVYNTNQESNKVKSMPKGIELTYYSKGTKTKQPTNIYKINVNKMVRDKIKIKEKIIKYI